MFIIKLNDDKTLQMTKYSVNYKLENNAENIWFILPQEINSYKLRECEINLNYLNQDNVIDFITLYPDVELYKNFLQCTIPITTIWTYKIGKVPLWITILQSSSELVLITNEVYLPINDSRESDGNIPLQTRVTLSDKINELFNNKADGISFTNSKLQLKSGDLLVGEPIDIDVSSIDDTAISNTSTYSSMKIESILTDLVNPLTCTLNISPSIAELGSSVNSTVLNWTYNKNIVSQTLNGLLLDSTLRDYNYTTSLTTQETFTLSATSASGVIVSKSATLNFYNGIYYGKSINTTYDENLFALLQKVLSDNKGRTITVTANTGEYIYYCLPSRLGVPIFTVGAFTGGFMKVATVDFTNSSNYTEPYDIYRSDNANLGVTNIVVS